MENEMLMKVGAGLVLVIFLLMVAYMFMQGGIGGVPAAIQYVCADGTVVDDPAGCPAPGEVVTKYVCADGTTVVGDSSQCPSAPSVERRYICPDGSVVTTINACPVIGAAAPVEEEARNRITGLEVADEEGVGGWIYNPNARVSFTATDDDGISWCGVDESDSSWWECELESPGEPTTSVTCTLRNYNLPGSYLINVYCVDINGNKGQHYALDNIWVCSLEHEEGGFCPSE
jgi:hypothetical protein